VSIYDDPLQALNICILDHDVLNSRHDCQFAAIFFIGTKSRVPITKGVFSSPFYPKKFGFWSIILQNGTKHHANFLAKRYPFSILDFGLKRPKKKPKSQKAFTHPMKNLAFWMELRTLMKILAFYISSFQSS
jgi:hypothetical protein